MHTKDIINKIDPDKVQCDCCALYKDKKEMTKQSDNRYYCKEGALCLIIAAVTNPKRYEHYEFNRQTRSR